MHKNVDVKRDRDALVDKTQFKIPQGQVPYGTTTHTYRLGLGTDAKLDRASKSISHKSFPRNPTDNLSFDPPARDRPFQKVFDNMSTKPDYNKNCLSSKPWEPKPVTGKTVNNRGSTEYNMITHQPNTYAGILPTSVLDRKSNNRMKGITEIRDLLRLTAVNTNHDL